MSRYVELDKQSSFTGDKGALKFLPPNMRAKADERMDFSAKYAQEIVTPQSSPGNAAGRADLLARAAGASRATKTGLMDKLRIAFEKGRGKLIPEYNNYSGLGQSDLLTAGAAALTAGIKALNPEEAKQAELQREQEKQVMTIKLVAGAVGLLVLAYFLFKPKLVKSRKRRKRAKRRR